MSDHDEMLMQSGQLGDELRALRDELCIEPDPQVRAAHVAAMEIAATELGMASEQDRVVSLHRARAARRRLRALAIPVAATVGVLGLTCGLAAAGGLPGPAQRQVARVASAVGWKIPDRPGSSSPSPSNRPEPGGSDGASTSTSTTSSSPSPSTSASTAPKDQGTPAVTPGAVTRDPGSGASPPTPSSGPATPSTTTPAPPSPGKSGAAPGHAGAGTTTVAPGKSGDAPGHNKSTPVTTPTTPGTSGIAPGKSGNAPGHNKDQADAG